jgi:hypothetical protein
MSENNTVAMFIQDANNQRVQVGWASPRDSSGIRTFEYSPGFENTHPRDVSFEDDEYSQKVAQEQAMSRLGDGTDGPDFEVKVNATNPDTSELAPVANTDVVIDRDISVGETPLAEVEPDSEENSFVPQNEEAPVASEPVDAAPDAEQSAGRTEDGPDAELAAEPVNATSEPVELNSGGGITSVEDDEEAEFQRLLEEEQAAEAKEETPTTRREARENEENV